MNGGTCTKSVDSYFNCSCTSSYQGTHCVGKLCLPLFYLHWTIINTDTIQRFRDWRLTVTWVFWLINNKQKLFTTNMLRLFITISSLKI